MSSNFYKSKIKNDESQISEGSTIINYEKQYKNFKDFVELITRKNQKIEEFRKELSDLLKLFKTVSFKKFPKKPIIGIIFAGLKDDKIKIGSSKTSYGDYFVEDIGKLLSVRRALNKKEDDILAFIGEFSEYLGVGNDKK